MNLEPRELSSGRFWEVLPPCGDTNHMYSDMVDQRNWQLERMKWRKCRRLLP